MDNLIFCLNATIPIFLTLLLGAFFRKVGLFTPDFVKQVNRFVFQGALPVLLFKTWGPRILQGSGMENSCFSVSWLLFSVSSSAS